MSNEIENKIGMLAELLGQDKNNIMDIFSQLTSSSSNSRAEESNNEVQVVETRDESRSPASKSPDLNMDTIFRAKKLFDTIGSNHNDPRVNLIHAIRPFLNPSRQKKLGKCIQLLQLSHVPRLLENFDKFNTRGD